VASIDAAHLQGGALRAGLEPWSSSRRSRRPSESSVLWFEALPSGRSPDRVRGAYRRHPNPRPALDPLRLLRPSAAARAFGPECGRLASPGDRSEGGPGQNLPKTRCKGRAAKPFHCPNDCNFSPTPPHPSPASSSVRSAPIEPPAAYPPLAEKGAPRSADLAVRRDNRRHGSTQAGTGALQRTPPPAPILTDFPTPRRSGFTLLPSGAQRGLLQKSRRAVAPPTTCYRKCHVEGTWRSNCFPVDHKPQADARRGAHLDDSSFPPYPD
jgi:hypothetical protein